MKCLSLILFSFSVSGAVLMSGGASSNGVWVKFEMRLEPGSPPLGKYLGGVSGNGNTIHRDVRNSNNNTYFGYDLTVDPLGNGRYRLRFAPLSKSIPDWTPLPLPGGPAIMEVRAGETVALDLFVNSSTGQKVTDYLTIKTNDRQQVTVAGPARDFSPADATIEVNSPHLSVDGKAVLESQGGVAGQAVWINVPEHGRFVFSLAPRVDLGMIKAGEIRGTTMTWHSGGHEYTITTDKSIASGSGAYNLYVFYIPRVVARFGMSAGPKPDPAIRAR